MLSKKEIDEIKKIENKKKQLILKRVMDFILSLIGIVFFSPLFIIIIIAIRVNSKGNTVFKQIRIGLNGTNFTIYKFRTMIINAEAKRTLDIDPSDLSNFVFQSKSDNRITSVGNFLRKTSLDELPQLFNVLLGNMSLVGPRPEIPEVVKYYSEEYKLRLIAKPGITGLAQISGRGEIELGKTVAFDIEYIKNFSIYYDIKIILKTILQVFKSEGAF